MREEPFGPIATIKRFSDLDDAIAQANATEYAFAAYLFTDSLDTRRRRRLRGRPRRHRRLPTPPARQRDRITRQTETHDAQQDDEGRPRRGRNRARRGDPRGRQDQRSLEGLRQALSKAKYIDLTNTLAEACRSGAASGPAQFKPTVNPARPGVHVRGRRVRGDLVSARDGPVRHAVRPAGALGARAGRDRRGPRIRCAVRPLVVINIGRPRPRRTRSTSCTSPTSRRGSAGTGRSRPGLWWSSSARTGPSSGRRTRSRRRSSPRAANFERRPRRAEVPAPQARHPLPRARAAGHGHDADARGRDWPTHHGAPRPRAWRTWTGGRQGRLVSFGSPSSRAASAATRATSRSARRSTKKGVRISPADAPLPAFGSDLHWDDCSAIACADAPFLPVSPGRFGNDARQAPGLPADEIRRLIPETPSQTGLRDAWSVVWRGAARRAARSVSRASSSFEPERGASDPWPSARVVPSPCSWRSPCRSSGHRTR